MKKENVIFVETTNSPLICPDGSKSKYNVYSKIWLSDRQEEGSLPLDILTNYENRHSSKELSDTELEKISRELSSSMGSTIKFDYKVDKNLIGGLKLQLGSFMIDTSIKNRLKKIEQRMLEN